MSDPVAAAPPPPIDIADDGFVSVKVAGKEARLDLWQVNNRLVELEDAAEGQPPNVLNLSIVEYLKELGFPAVSTRAACAFTAAIYRAMADQRKKAESPESPSPSAS